MLKPMGDWGRGADWRGDRLTCPACGRKNDAMGSPLVKDRPAPGDFSVCIRCVCILIVQPDYSLVVATKDVLRGLDPEERANIERVQRAIREMHAEFGQPAMVPDVVAWPPRK